jgi:FKBP-type peptidyl-prolyl cis-trans isomerase FklB
MRLSLTIILSLTMLIGICSADGKADPKDEKVKASYSVGHKVGTDLNRNGVDVDPEEVLRGVRDALAGREPAIPRQEMHSVLAELQKQIVKSQEQKTRAEAEKNLADGKAFLAANAKKEGIVELPSGLQYKIITEGSGTTPKEKDTVTVHYRGTLINGAEFDSSYSRGKPATFRTDQVIAGWKEALSLMKEGSKWQLFVPASLGYGDRNTGRITPNSTLIFEVELIQVKESK